MYSITSLDISHAFNQDQTQASGPKDLSPTEAEQISSYLQGDSDFDYQPSRKPSRIRKHTSPILWLESEQALLLRLKEQNFHWEDIANSLSRSRSACQKKYERLKSAEAEQDHCHKRRNIAQPSQEPLSERDDRFFGFTPVPEEFRLLH